ncbi:TRAP transporter small permease [Halomonas icarae]|uniref:TRAP transporter small permease protein n=1 Tax=Halomonas icarae TaxID=2691040 RepID=A0A7X5AMR1_9GAMM|nr:TRAP transporter small permease [Halomonas icarae]MDR5902459.1 TRAP transporter small permease [Halomonas icarae]NAW14116.1 TRAP transporter small permease subunit [Halomonas icarae]
MRRTLDRLYDAAGYLAALFLVGILVTIVIQLVCRILGVTFEATEAAGFCMAAATFFGLAHTFRAGSHVRITLTLDRLPRHARRVVEIVNCTVAGVAVVFLSWHIIALMVQSYRFQDVSPGLLAIQFWIPQAGVALGVTLFATALLDELVSMLRGHTPSYDSDDESLPFE